MIKRKRNQRLFSPSTIIVRSGRLRQSFATLGSRKLFNGRCFCVTCVTSGIVGGAIFVVGVHKLHVALSFTELVWSNKPTTTWVGKDIRSAKVPYFFGVFLSNKKPLFSNETRVDLPSSWQSCDNLTLNEPAKIRVPLHKGIFPVSIFWEIKERAQYASATSTFWLVITFFSPVGNENVATNGCINFFR